MRFRGRGVGGEWGDLLFESGRMSECLYPDDITISSRQQLRQYVAVFDRYKDINIDFYSGLNEPSSLCCKPVIFNLMKTVPGDASTTNVIFHAVSKMRGTPPPIFHH